MQITPPGFHLIYLPYADDFREIDKATTEKCNNYNNNNKTENLFNFNKLCLIFKQAKNKLKRLKSVLKSLNLNIVQKILKIQLFKKHGMKLKQLH